MRVENVQLQSIQEGVGVEREGGLTTRRGFRAVEFHPDFKTMQAWSKLERSFRWLRNVPMHIMFTTKLILALYTDGRKGVLVEAGKKQHITRGAKRADTWRGGIN